MFTKKLCILIVSLMVCVGLSLSPFQGKAQEQELAKKKKEFVPILPDAREGALPQVSAAALTFNARAKTGQIPLEIAPAGVWKSTEALVEANYDLLEFEIEDPNHLVEVGEPNVPVKVIEVDIPPNAEVTGVNLKPELLKTVKNVNLVPNQEPLPIGLGKEEEKLIFEKPMVTKNRELYQQKTAYPGKFYEIVTTDYYGDRKVVILKTYPAQYYPAAQEVKFYRLKGALEFKADEIPKAKTRRAVLSKSQMALGLTVSNIKDAGNWEAYKREIGEELQKESQAVELQEPFQEFEKAVVTTIPCVIIYADLFQCPATTLASHHTNKGYKSIAVRVRNIIRYVSGKDAPDKIRNYLRNLRSKYSTRWVILFGDVTKYECGVTNVPTRMVVDPAPYGGVDDGWIPCDYYYACLDGTWDANGNGKYGEIADKPDLLPEMCVGRLPVNNLDDAIRVVGYIKGYENSPPARRGALLAANDLGWGCHEITFKENTYLPLVRNCGFAAVWRLYQKWGNLSITTFSNFVNRGVDFIQYYGHGSPSGTQLMSMVQVCTYIRPTPSQPVLFALSCSTSRYDNRECFGEVWLEKGKSSGYIGSTRVAYGSLNTGEGLDIRFIRYYCGLRRTGCALDYAKYQLFRSYGWDNYTIKTILEFTLFGDPLMLHVK